MDDLQFYEAPDYAALFEKEFQRLNEGWDNAEAMEQTNDAQRIANAKRTPLKALEGIATLTEKAVPLLQAEEKRRQDAQQDRFNLKNYSQEQKELNYAIYSKGKKVLIGDHQVSQKYAEKLKAEGRDIDASLIIDKSEWTKTRFGFLRARIDASKDNLISDFEAAHPNFKSYKPSEARTALQGFLTERESQFRQMPTVLVNEIKDHFNTFEDTLMTEKNEEVETIKNQEENLRNQGLVRNALIQTDPQALKERVLDLVELNYIPEGGKRKDGWNFVIGHTLKLLETGQIKAHQAHKIKEILLEHRGEQGKEKDVGSMYYKVFEATGFDGAVAKAVKVHHDNVKQDQENNANDVLTKLRNIEKDQNRKLTRSEINAEIRNWDATKNGAIPEWLNSWASSFDAQPMNAPDRPSYANQTAATSLIATYASTRVADNKRLDDTNKEIITQRAGSFYQHFYAEEMLNAGSEQAAHLEALRRTKEAVDRGELDEMPTINIDSEKEHKLNLSIAAKAIEAEPNIINTGIIYGSESALEAVREDPNRVHPFYKQLARKLKVEPHVLQFNQLAIANKQFGKEEPIKSDIVKEFEELDPNVQELLSGHTTPGRVQRALIEQFGEDRDISYDDVGFLIDERLAQIPVKETVFEPPKEIKKSPRSRRRGNTNVNTELQQSIKKWFNVFSTSAAEAGSYRTEVEEPEWVTEWKTEVQNRPRTPRSRNRPTYNN
jgi:hypothetical protein